MERYSLVCMARTVIAEDSTFFTPIGRRLNVGKPMKRLLTIVLIPDINDNDLPGIHIRGTV